MKIVVIGAGISGCVCAWRLAQEGHSVTLLEKGRGVGGRMATRRMEGARIDHGAQFFTVRDPRMKRLLQIWQRKEAVTPWYDRIAGREDLSGRIRFRGTNGMTGPAKSLAQAFRTETEFFVDQIIRKGDHWSINERNGRSRTVEGDHLVITIPSVQLLELFERSEYELETMVMNKLKGICHTRCLAVLAVLDRPSEIPHPGTVTHPVEEIDWLSDNQIKGISEVPACTIHASNDYSQKYWDSPDEERIPYLISVAEDNLKAKLTSWTSHRWGFAKPLVTFGATHWHSITDGITLAGDGFGGERIENAAMSGWDAADEILKI